MGTRYCFLDKTVDKAILFESYKKFYGKEPNLRRENMRNLTIEMHAMAYLLGQYGITYFSHSYNTYNYNELFIKFMNLYMPVSIELYLLISKMLDCESKDFEMPELSFSDSNKIKINLIGSKIMSTITEKENPIDALRLLFCIYYTFNSLMLTDNEIVEFNKCLLSDVIEAKELNDTLTLELSLNETNS